MKQFGLSDNHKFNDLAREVARKRGIAAQEAARTHEDRLARNAAAEIAGMIERCEWMKKRTGDMQEALPELRRVHAALALMLEDLHEALRVTMEGKDG
jgi:phage shock protein A